jgi:phosphate transport system protein
MLSAFRLIFNESLLSSASYSIDQKENQIEEECLKVLALYHPVANDLKFVIAILKVNNDLERMGDLVANIGERSIYLP